jgi:hypothetical protein
MVLEHKNTGNNLKAVSKSSSILPVRRGQADSALQPKSEIQIAYLFQGAANVMAQEIRDFRAERPVCAAHSKVLPELMARGSS